MLIKLFRSIAVNSKMVFKTTISILGICTAILLAYLQISGLIPVLPAGGFICLAIFVFSLGLICKDVLKNWW